MSKLHNIYQTTRTISFLSPEQEFQQYHNRFLCSDLGRLYQAIPWADLCKSFRIKQKKQGRPCLFTPQGKIALMFLKSDTGLSDRKLIEQLNSNIDYQLFCGIWIGVDQGITDYKIVSKVRVELSKKLNIVHTQKVLATAWKPFLNQTNVLLEDATCYTTSMRHPTNVKLLWESVDWLYGQMKITCKFLSIPTPRTKYLSKKEKYKNYSRKRRKNSKDRHMLTRSLLHLLDKLIQLTDAIEYEGANTLELPEKYFMRKQTLKTILSQQQQMFETGESIPGRIVSISKSYIRPIVRGKERTKVEFGAKVNVIQVDNINFIETLDFNPFNEGTRLRKSIWCGRSLFGKITHVSADAIYATNYNRSYCKSQHIITSFTRKGRAGKYEQQRKQISSILSTARATRMEGSFGVEKQFYGLEKIKARTKETEILWIFFGMHTANAVKISRRIRYPIDNQLVA